LAVLFTGASYITYQAPAAAKIIITIAATIIKFLSIDSPHFIKILCYIYCRNCINILLQVEKRLLF